METGHLFSSLYFQRKRRQKIIQERLLLGKCVLGTQHNLVRHLFAIGVLLDKIPSKKQHNVCWYSKSIVSWKIIAVFWPQQRTILLTREGGANATLLFFKSIERNVRQHKRPEIQVQKGSIKWVWSHIFPLSKDIPEREIGDRIIASDWPY